LYGSSGALSVDGERGAALPGFSLPDIAQNILLYIPFGVFGGWTLRRSVASSTSRGAAILTLALLYSVAMEALQTVSAARVASPLDVLANICGAAIGIITSERAADAVVAIVERLRPTGVWTTRARYLFAAVLAVIVIVAWYPFDVTLDVSTLGDRSRPIRYDPWLWPGTIGVLSQAARYFLLTMTMTACLPRLKSRAIPVAAVATVAAAFVIDGGQLAMGRYPIGVAGFLSQSAGVCAAAAAAWVAARARDGW